MSAQNNDEIVSNFSAITGVDAERARFYLESSGWNIDIAMSTFYQEDEDMDVPEAPAEAAAGPQEDYKPPQQKPRFATLANMTAPDESGSDSDNEEGQAFYTGGSERGGGQQIIGPKKKKADKIVKDVFESAQKHGAEKVEAGSSTEMPRPGGRPAFRGTGYRLGETEGEPVEQVLGAPVRDEARTVMYVLKLWKNGFSVNDGPLREYNEPQNVEFLNYIKRNEIPPELSREARGGQVSMDMEDHRGEDYVKPKVSLKPFTGEGNRLGSVAPPVATAAPPAEAQNNETAAKNAVPVDAAKPVTSIQIRLADGARLVVKLNHSHTVADVRRYIETLHPQYNGANYALMTTFPNRELTDVAESLETAKLLNSAIVQRMK